MKALQIASWMAYAAGFALWLYGYYTTGTPAIIDWPHLLPTWIAMYLPNLEAEAGMLVMVVATVPLTWITIQQQSRS